MFGGVDRRDPGNGNGDDPRHRLCHSADCQCADYNRCRCNRRGQLINRWHCYDECEWQLFGYLVDRGRAGHYLCLCNLYGDGSGWCSSLRSHCPRGGDDHDVRDIATRDFDGSQLINCYNQAFGPLIEEGDNEHHHYPLFFYRSEPLLIRCPSPCLNVITPLPIRRSG